MTYTDAQVAAVSAAMGKYRAGKDGEIGAALAVVGLSTERAAREAAMRDDMIRFAHRAGAPLRQLAEVSGLNRKRVTAIVEADFSGSSTRAWGAAARWPGLFSVTVSAVAPGAI